ncbi:NADPH-dependent FMN reductase [Pseudomonas xanthosomatis]|uniref:NADPH-dependent FMN reductase n=1 Tax=Pseudomonas xanthosomatis TaxID=2842356 RepID=UPI003514395D
MNENTPVRIAVLLGSLREKSQHAAVARALQSIADRDVEIQILDSIAAFPHYNADVQADGFPQCVVAMGKALQETDALVIVTPEYNYSVPGVLKNALDWISRLPEAPLSGKPVAIQTGSPGSIGGARAQYHLRQILVFFNAKVLNKPEVMISQLASKVDVESNTITDLATIEVIGAQLRALAAMAREY